MKNNYKSKGFTIVELLIVIVVIAILAAIVIVAYNGVQKRANSSAAASGANALQKKAEAYNADKGSYPVSVSTSSTANFNELDISTLSGSGLSLGTPTPSNGKNTFRYEYCINGTTAPTTASTATGARITYYDYDGGSLPTSANAQIKIGTANGTQSMTCTAAS